MLSAITPLAGGTGPEIEAGGVMRRPATLKVTDLPNVRGVGIARLRFLGRS
jgi:hypothetical protein